MKEIQKVVQKLSREQESAAAAAAAAAAYEPVQKHKVTPSILGWLKYLITDLWLKTSNMFIEILF